MHKFKLPNIEEEQSVLKTVRIKLSTLKKIEELANKSNLSVNRVINECIDFALKNLDINSENNKI